jgi:hypothetical protein
MTTRNLNTGQRLGDWLLFLFFAGIFAAIVSHA